MVLTLTALKYKTAIKIKTQKGTFGTTDMFKTQK